MLSETQEIKTEMNQMRVEQQEYGKKYENSEKQTKA